MEEYGILPIILISYRKGLVVNMKTSRLGNRAKTKFISLTKFVALFLSCFLLFSVIGCGMSDEEERMAAVDAKKVARVSMDFLQFPMYCEEEFQRRGIDNIGNLISFEAVEYRLKEAKLAAKTLDSLPRKLKYLEQWTEFRDEARYLMGLNIDLLEDFKKILENSKKGKRINSDVDDFSKEVGKYKERYEKLKELYSPISHSLVR